MSGVDSIKMYSSMVSIRKMLSCHATDAVEVYLPELSEIKVPRSAELQMALSE